jgi:flagellar hook-associated protein 1 FlgK
VLTPAGLTLDLVQQDVVQSGSLGALIDLRDNVLPTAQSQLDEIAAGLAQAFSTNQTAGTATTSGAAEGYSLDLTPVRDGNDFTFTYTDGGTQKSARVVRVDDPASLPMDYVDGNGTRVIGLNFNSNDAASIATQLNTMFGGKVNFSGTGANLTILDDGAASTSDILSATVRSTSSGMQNGSLGLSLFVDQGGADFTNSLGGKGQKLGFASRISVNNAVAADNSLLVKYDPNASLGDTARTDYLANQLDSMRFISADRSGPRSGNFTLNGTVSNLISQTVNYQGDTIAAALSDKDAQSQSLDVLGQRMDAEYGVNVDEEMSRLMELQNAYAANARVVSVVQELLQALTNAI